MPYEEEHTCQEVVRKVAEEERYLHRNLPLTKILKSQCHSIFTI
jgi:hypothetical protein